MKRLSTQLFILLTAFLCALPHHSHAESGYDLGIGLIPAVYYGQWATPRCNAPTSVLTIYGHLISESLAPQSNFTYRVTNTAMSDGIFLAHAGNINLFFADIRDNRLTAAKILDGQIKDDVPIPDQVWPRAKNYYKCDHIAANWESLTPVAVEAMPKFYELEKACKGAFIEKSLPCQQETFSFLDVDADGLLSLTELERAYTITVFYAGSYNCDFYNVFNDNVKNDQRTFAETAIQIMDENKDYRLSADEIINGWDKAKLEPSFQKFLEYSNDLSVLLYFIPQYPYIERENLFIKKPR